MVLYYLLAHSSVVDVGVVNLKDEDGHSIPSKPCFVASLLLHARSQSPDWVRLLSCVRNCITSGQRFVVSKTRLALEALPSTWEGVVVAACPGERRHQRSPFITVTQRFPAVSGSSLQSEEYIVLPSWGHSKVLEGLGSVQGSTFLLNHQILCGTREIRERMVNYLTLCIHCWHTVVGVRKIR